MHLIFLDAQASRIFKNHNNWSNIIFKFDLKYCAFELNIQYINCIPRINFQFQFLNEIFVVRQGLGSASICEINRRMLIQAFGNVEGSKQQNKQLFS